MTMTYALGPVTHWLVALGVSALALTRCKGNPQPQGGAPTEVSVIELKPGPVTVYNEYVAQTVRRKSEGMSIFIVDLRQAIGHGLAVQPIPNLVNHETNEIFFDNLEIPEENLIGEEYAGFKYILDGERRADADRGREHR